MSIVHDNTALYCVDTADMILDGRQNEILNPPLKFLKVGRLSEVSQIRTKEQLDFVMEKISGGSIYFLGVFDDGITRKSDAELWRHEYERIFTFLRELNLKLFAQIDISRAPRDVWGEFSIKRVLDGVFEFMEVLTSREPLSYWERSSFELMHSGPVSNICYMDSYAAIYHMLKHFSKKMSIGLRCTTDFSPRDLEELEQNLTACRNARCEPDFITLSVNSRICNKSPKPDHCVRHSSKNYLKSQIEALIHIINDCVSSVEKIYIKKWTINDGHDMLDHINLSSGIYEECGLLECCEIISGVELMMKSE
ncbi:MAG: hypothetical protein LBQ58_09210 [Synergistaceae bacterium]|jgi:hypothetical protein|nr:hypothetical protein [Synergistaceae bacterium]